MSLEHSPSRQQAKIGSSNEPSEQKPQPAKRRGRPPKIKPPIEPPRRKRGRPPKVAQQIDGAPPPIGIGHNRPPEPIDAPPPPPSRFEPPHQYPHLTREELAARWRTQPDRISRSYRRLGLTPIKIMKRMLFTLDQNPAGRARAHGRRQQQRGKVRPAPRWIARADQDHFLECQPRNI
jgi:hypothetical protein